MTTSAVVVDVVLDLEMKEAGSSDCQRGVGGHPLRHVERVVGDVRRLNSEGYQCVLQQFQSGSRVRVRSKGLINCVTTALVSRQKCDGQVKDAIDKMPSRQHVLGRDGQRHSQASTAGQTRVQQCGSVGWNRSLDEHACNSAQSGRHPSGGRKWRRRTWERSDSTKTLYKKSTLKTLSS